MKFPAECDEMDCGPSYDYTKRADLQRLLYAVRAFSLGGTRPSSEFSTRWQAVVLICFGNPKRQ